MDGVISYLAGRDERASLGRDAGVGAVWFAVGSLLMWTVPELRIDLWGPGGGQADPASFVVLAVACTAALLRRRQAPAGLVLVLAVLVAGGIWTGRVEIGTIIAFTDLLYCSVLYPSRRTAEIVAVSAGLLVVALTVLSLVNAGGREAILSALNLSLLVGIPVVWAAEVRRHRELAAVERERAAEAERAAAREREAAIAAERARMARDLHDVVAGRLSAIALQSEAALQPGTDPELARRVLTTIRESGVAALGEMRAMIGLLRAGDATDPPGAPPRLAELDDLLDAARSGGLDAHWSDERPPGTPVPAPVELAAYRIVQESLTNAGKHAPGAPVRVRTAVEDGALVVEVRNGTGGPAANAPGLHGGTGLAGLGERARAAGGTLSAGPDGEGWLVRGVLDLTQEGYSR